MSNVQGKIVCVTGASGSGKTTLVEHLFATYPGIFQDIPSILTRPPRANVETLNIHVSREEFERLWDAGKLLWKIENHGYLYGTRKEDVRNALARKSRSILIMTPRCIPLLMEFCECEQINSAHFLLIHVLAPQEDVITARLSARGDSPESIRTRTLECRTWDDYVRALPYPVQLLENSGVKEEFLTMAEHIVFWP